MSIEAQYLFYRTDLVTPAKMDQYYAQWWTIASIEAFLAYESSFSRLGDSSDPVPVYEILSRDNPKAHRIYAFDSIDDIMRPEDIESPFISGVRYPDDYTGGFCSTEDTSIISIAEIGEGKKTAPQFWAFDCDLGLFDDYDHLEGVRNSELYVYGSRWHISGCSAVVDGSCRTTLQFTYYLTDPNSLIEPPDTFTSSLYKLLDLILRPVDSSYCRYGNQPVFGYPLALNHRNSEELDGKVECIDETIKTCIDALQSTVAYDDGIPYECSEQLLNQLLGDDQVTDLVNHLYETRWLLFENMIRDTERTLPVVLVCSERNGEFPISYNVLSRDLMGMADVYYADLSDDYVNKRLNRIFRRRGNEHEFRCGPGRVRVYPGLIDITNPEDAQKCPRFRKREAEECQDSSSLTWFTHYPAVFDFILSLQRLSNDFPIDAAGLASSRAFETADRFVAARDLLRIVNSEQASEMDGLVLENEEVLRQNDEYKLEIELLNEQLEKVSALYNGTQKQLASRSVPDQRIEKYYSLEEAQKRHRKLIQELIDGQKLLAQLDHGLPSTVAEALKAIAEAYADRVLVLPEAYSSAEKYGKRNLDDAWAILRRIPTTLWDLYFDGEHSIEREFKNATGFELALTERKLTQATESLMKMRELSYDEGRKTAKIVPHIKGGTRDHPLRIHYAVDKESRLIVIGHCGGHMPTAGGKQ